MKLKTLLVSTVALLCSAASWAQTDVTDTYIGSATAIIGSHSWEATCSHNHKLTAVNDGVGYFNSQTIEVNHSFKECTDAKMSGTTNPYESWTNEVVGEGYMLGRMMVLPPGKYTLKFSALSRGITNTVAKCGDEEKSFDASETCQEFTFNLNVSQNTVYQFGVYQKSSENGSDWAAMGSISLTTSTNYSPIAHNLITDWTEGLEVNTWSTEGKSDGTYFLEPFIQKWISSGSTLANGTYQKSYIPSENGFYKVNAWVRLIKESAGQTTYSGATMFAGTNSVSVCSGGTLYNSNKVHLGTYSAKIDATKDVAFNYGFTLSSANFNWLSFKNITIEKITMADFAETFSSGSTVTANTWYKFTTGSGSDAYTLSSNGDATITYTTDGTLADDNDITTTWTLHAKRNAVLAPNTTYYIKSSAAVTLTTNASSVNSSYVSGWTKVTSISDLQDSPEDYFFAIFSANNTGLILGASSSYSEDANVKQRLHYKTAADPLSSSAYLFEIENYDDQFVLKSCAIDKYFNNTSGAPWNYHANASSTSSDCKITATLTNGAYTLQTANAEGGTGNYIGLWWQDNNNKGYVNNEYLAGNKQEFAKGSFLIYRLAKSNIDLTSMITNPDFSASPWSNGWTGCVTGSQTKADAFADQSGNVNFTGHFAEMWVRNATMSAADLNQTISKLPAGVYTLSAYIQAGITCKLYAAVTGQSEQYIEYMGSPASKSLRFIVNSTGDVQIGLKHNGDNSKSGDIWVAVDGFQLHYVGDLPSSSDKTAFTAALTSANGKTLGFEVGDYAPYTNTAAITTRIAAAEVDVDAVTKSELATWTTALTSSTWTVNPERMNAIYDGDFSESEIGTYNTTRAVTGWDKVEGMREVVTSNVEGSPLYNKKGIYVWGSRTVTYGNTAGYTIPLSANKIYRASYKRASWENNSNRRGALTIKNSSDISVATFETPSDVYATKYDEVGSPVSESIYFVTGNEADTYTLSLTPWGNAVFTDVELISVDALPLSESSTVNYMAGTYPTVALDRSFSTTNYSTLCLPFAMTSAQTSAAFDKVYAFNAVDGSSLEFVEASEIAAGTPYLVKANNPTLSVSDVALNPATEAGHVQQDGGVTFQGTFTPIDALPINGTCYVVSSNNLYLVDSEVGLDGYRAYFQTDGGSTKNFVLDFDDATAINAVEAAQNEKAVIYNLAGQRLSKAQKGVNIINGKKVLVK